MRAWCAASAPPPGSSSRTSRKPKHRNRLAPAMGKSQRAAICNGQRPVQVGRDRLAVATPVPGLFLCGDGAGGRGIGIEMAARSGTEAARHMLAHGGHHG